MPDLPQHVMRANIRAVVNPSEEVVHTLHFVRVNTTQTDNVSVQQLADKIVTEWTSFLTTVQAAGISVRSRMRDDLVYKTVDVYELGANGQAITQAQALFGVTALGTDNSTELPPEVALVASLRTGLPGRSKRGRLYLAGFTNTSITTGGLVQATTQQAVSQGLSGFGSAMKMQVGANVDRINWVVLSRTLGQVNRITEVRTGNLFDVQRRRQSALTETFASNAIAY